MCNAAPFLAESIGSILRQSFADFELVILENGSTDRSRALTREWATRDPRIRLEEDDTPLGLAESGNRVVLAARAPLVARMDADDVSHPSRLERQVEVLAADPGATAVGVLYDGIDRHGRTVRPRDRSLLARRTTEAPFPHGSVMFRREAFDAIGGYRDDRDGWEDLDFLQRLGEVGRILVLPDRLYRVRFHAGSTTTALAADWVRDAAGAKRRVRTERFPAGPGEGVHADDSQAGRLYVREAMRLWAGERPALLRLLRFEDVRAHPLRRLPILAWAGWGRVSPGTLRAALRLWIRIRDARSARAVPDGRPVEWRFG